MPTKTNNTSIQGHVDTIRELCIIIGKNCIMRYFNYSIEFKVFKLYVIQ